VKFILSRKGFDSKNGGYPSPILPNGKMISLPIPADDRICYSDLQLKYDGYRTYCDLMKDLMPEIRSNKDKIKVDNFTTCHLDPDINGDAIERADEWLPIFGQIDGAETVLENKGITKNDIFLFFGTFKNTVLSNGKIIFDRSDTGKHIIFGYLQVGKIFRCDAGSNIEDWMEYHPHCDKERRKIKNNTIYIAREKLSWSNETAGAGTFNFHDSLVLTKKGLSKSRWNLDPAIFRGLDIGCHAEKSWKNGYFQSTPIGQEFVIEQNKAVEEYFKDLILNNIKKRSL